MMERRRYNAPVADHFPFQLLAMLFFHLEGRVSNRIAIYSVKKFRPQPLMHLRSTSMHNVRVDAVVYKLMEERLCESKH